MREHRLLAPWVPALLLLLMVFLGAPSDASKAVFSPDLLPAAYADGDEKEDDGTEEGDDLGDKHVPFADQVNKAIEEGVKWLRATPKWKFSLRKHDVYHWGLVKGQKIYGGGKGPQYRHPAGPTALAIYTLLKCGVSPKDHEIKKGFNWLRENHKITAQYDGVDGSGFTWNHTEASSSYELSVMILALTAKYDAYKKSSGSKKARRKGKLKIRNKDDREWLIEMCSGLIERRGNPVPDAPREAKIGWRYNTPTITRGGGGRKGGRSWKRGGTKAPPHANQDMSGTQLAAMALLSAQRFGIKVPLQIWKDILEFTLGHQEKEGPERERHMPGFVSERYGGKPKDHARGFMYIKGSSDGSEGVATGSMTACGVANLLIAREMISKSKKGRKTFMASGQLKEVDTAIHDGLAWLDLHWSPFTNTRSRYGYHIYYLYCVERAMDILGKRLIGKNLWYPAGAKEILKRQQRKKIKLYDKKGRPRSDEGVFWMTNATHEPKDVLDTCFALLYLKRATKGITPGVVVTGGNEGGPKDSR